MKKIILLLLLLIGSSVNAQDYRFTAEDIAINSYTTLNPATLEQLCWLPGEVSYSFVEDVGERKMLVKGSRSGRKEIRTHS